MDSQLVYNKFNRGVLDPLALARDDIGKVNSSASLMENWLPQRLGAMSMRPGLEHIHTLEDESENLLVEFVRAITDRALLVFQNQTLALYFIDENELVTKVPGHNATTTITNGTFTSDIASWTDSSGGSSTTAYSADYGGSASLTGEESSEAVLSQTLSTETGAEHVFRVVVREAPITVKLGTAGADSTDIFEGTLLPGVHHLNVTPAGQVTVTFSNSRKYRALVSGITTPATVGFDFTDTDYDLLSALTGAKLPELMHEQSGDILYFAVEGVPQFQVERRGIKSWSLVSSRFEEGPFGLINNTDVTLTPSTLSGNPTLTASRAFFTASSVGQLFKLASTGQNRQATVSAEDNGTGSVRVVGVGDSRAFAVSVTGAFIGTATLQRSTDDATWVDVEAYTAFTSKTFNDELDNSTFFYRLHVKTGEYTSGSIYLTLNYTGGSVEGICRVTAYTSTTVVDTQALTELGATTATRDWYQGQWNLADNTFPSAVTLYEGRLWYAGKSQLWGSVSDAYASFDRSLEGASASIYRTVGFGPTDKISWLKGTVGLVMAIATDEISVRSSSYGEVLSNLNVNLRSGSTEGASSVMPLRADKSIFYVHRNSGKLYAIDQVDAESFSTLDQTKLNPSICGAGIVRLAVTRQPETRVWVLLADGTLAVELLDLTENVQGWSTFVTPDGAIDSLAAVPGSGEDRLYTIVRRDDPNSAGTVTTLERLAKFSEAEGGNVCKIFDSAIQLSSPSASVDISSSPALDGRTADVGVWADGRYLGEFTPASSIVTLDAAYTDVTVGIPYTATFGSNKLIGYKSHSVLTERRRVTHIGLIAQNLWPSTLCYAYENVAPSYQNLPLVENGATVNQEVLMSEYDEPPFEFAGDSDTDSRVYLQAKGPATVLAMVYRIEAPNDPTSKKT